MSLVVPSPLEVFPECPTYGFTAQPQYLVKLVAREGGFERVDRRWSRPLNVYTAVPIGNRDEVEIQSILYFWHAMGGRATAFRFKDWTDFQSCPVQNDPAATDQPFETVSLTGGGTAYQLVKVYQVGSIQQVREITQPKGDTIIVANASGATQTDWTLDEATGLLKPGAGFTGTPHSWGGEFYVPVRFDSELSVGVSDKQIQTVDFTLREKRVSLSTVFDAGSGADGGTSPGGGSPGGGSPGGGSGLTWTALGGPVPFNAVSLAFGGGSWVVVGQDGTISRSTNDGASWTVTHPSTFGGPDAAASIAYSNGVFMAGLVPRSASPGTSRIQTSTDGGATWSADVTVATGFTMGTITSIAGDGAGNWLINDGATYAHSTNSGATWTVGSTLVWAFYLGPSYWDAAGSQWVMLGLDHATVTPRIFTSADGVTLTAHDPGSQVDILVDLSFDGTHWLLGLHTTDASGDTRVATTPAGLASATGHSSGLTGTVSGVCAADGLFFAFGFDGTDGTVASSTDGTTWDVGVLNIPSEQVSPGCCEFNATSHTFLAIGNDFGNQSKYTVP